jgi:dienelactone hydrolase
MQAIATPSRLETPTGLRSFRPRRPSWRRAIAYAVLVLAVTATTAVVSTLAYLRLPAPTGPEAIGKTSATWDVGGATARSIRVTAWYPAVPGTGSDGRYVADLDRIDDALIASGQVGPVEVAGLGFVEDPARMEAAIAGDDASRYPLVILSPGNATNVEFYGALAEDLASHGFIVVGIDHPGQVAAVALDGEVVAYAGDPPLAAASTETPRRIDERVTDIAAVLDRLATTAPGLGSVAARVDLAQVGVMGHSNGGLAAVQACADRRVTACLNIDGQAAGGPFGTRQGAAAPDKPFLYLTKETRLHPELAAAFEAGGADTFRVVVGAAAHDQFADGARFRPRLLPTPGTADDVITVSRGFTRAFFEHTLRGAPRTVFAEVDAPTDVQVYVYPLIRG